MSKIVDSKFFKPFVFLLAFAVISLNVLPSVSKVSASDLNRMVEEADEKVGAIILESLKFNEDKTTFVGFDEEYAKSQGLKEKDFVNVDVFFGLTGEEFLVFKNAKLDLESSDSTYGVQSAKWKAYVKLAAVIAAMTFVGKALITQMTNDLYKLGVTKFCKKWKKYKPIKNACKDLGYIK